jgi:hypothetical protein
MTLIRKACRLGGLLLALAAFLAAQTAMASDRSWEFEVSLDNRKIGYHTFDLSEDGDRRVLETEAAFDVKLLFVTAFRYRHSNVEVWDDGCLESINAVTDSNGKVFEVRGTRKAQRLTVMRSNGDDELEECVRTFAYWDPAVLGAERLLNSQTGEYESVTVVADGDDTVDVAGTSVPAKRFTLSTKSGDIKLWYSDDMRCWLALEAPARGGRTIRYQPVRLPADLGGLS